MSTILMILIGMVIPFWTVVVLAVVGWSKNRNKPQKPSLVHDYTKLMQECHAAITKREGQPAGPIPIAHLREMKKYPEYRDITLLYLEELSIKGSGKFDQIIKTELKAVEAHLLGLEYD